MKALLIVVTWLHTGPYVSTQPVPSMQTCLAAASVVTAAVKGQARSNMTSPHRDLVEQGDPRGKGRVLFTGAIGREVARIRCVATS